MAPNPSRLRFYADESALGVGKALTAARQDFIHAGHKLIPEVPLGSLDTEWMPRISERGLVVLARDKRIRTKPGERILLSEHGLRVFWIAGKRDLSTWDQLVRLVNRWSDIEEVLRDRGSGPWLAF